jgi:hypothetical protein
MPQPSAQPPSTSDMRVVTAPKLPEPNAPGVFDEFIGSMTNNAALQRKSVEDAYKRQRSEIDLKQKEAQTKIDAFNKKQEGVIEGGVKENLTPFRADLENSERNRLSIDKNFEDNQKLVNELDTLLTQSNNMMTQLRGSKIPGLAGISQSPRALQAMADVSARVGVIQAVMDARNGQISQGYNMIDRSVNAINADRQDQLNYYSTLYDFYQNQKDEEGKKIYQLDQQEQSYINKQIGLLEGDMERSQATADYIKELMINPESAKFMADAGVTLNDSVESIQTKMAQQADIVERKAVAEEVKKELFDAGIKTQFAIRNGEIVRTADGWSFKDEEEFKKMTGMSVQDAQAKGMVSEYSSDVVINRQQVVGLMDKFWDAGIQPGDDVATATAKAMRSPSYLETMRRSSGGGGGGGSSDGSKAASEGIGLYNSTIEEALLGGASPEEAVFAAMSIADQYGTKLTAKEQTALLQYARESKTKLDSIPGEAAPGEEQQSGPDYNSSAEEIGRQIPSVISDWSMGYYNAKKKLDDTVNKNVVGFTKGVVKGIGDFFK